MESMSWVDALVLVWVALSALVGFHRGLTAQVVSLVGLALGGFAGARIGPLFLSDGSPWVPFASLIGALVGALLLQAAASIAGGRLRDRLSGRPPLRVADGAGGVLVGAALGLAVAWLGAVTALQLDRPVLRGAVRDSAILSGLVDAVPPRAVLRTLARLDPLPLIAAPPDLRLPPPDPSVAGGRAARAAARSVVKVETFACGTGVQGSGWVVRRGLVATNVHVITGADELAVAAPNGQVLPARAVYADPGDDVALLRVPGLKTRPLRLGSRVDNGAEVVLLGYPEDGPLSASAGVAGQPTKVFAANAYGGRPRLRTVVPLRGQVERGDSGGPVVDRGGDVVAMMFAASTDGDGGFGVPASEIAAALDAPHRPVESGPCPA
jgi:S1-C subfamily serine protease